MKTLSQTRSKLANSVAMNVLRLAANVANGEQIVIGNDTFEIDIINTDSNVNTSEALNATDTETVLVMAAHGRVAGNLLRIENEIVRVKSVVDASTIVIARGSAGTTKATHVSGSDIYQSDAAPAAPLIPIGLVTTLTPTAAAPAIVDTINDLNTGGVFAYSVSVNEIVVQTADGVQPRLLPCTETLAGSNNVWAASAMYGVASTEVRGVVLSARAANATEVALDHMLFNFSFSPVAVMIQVRTAAGALKTWDGAITVSGKKVTVTNGGASDWAATDVVTVLASE